MPSDRGFSPRSGESFYPLSWRRKMISFPPSIIPCNLSGSCYSFGSCVCVWELIDSNKLGIYIYFGPLSLSFFPPFLTSAALTQTHIYFSLSLSRVVFYSFFCGGYNTYSGMQIVGWWLTAARLDWWVRGPWKDKGV